MRRTRTAAISFALTLATLIGCGSGSSDSDDDDATALIGTNETPAEDAPVDFGDQAGLDGLWDANTIGGVAVLPGTAYFFFDTTAPGEVSAAFFALDAASNCLRNEPGTLTLIAPGVYEDEVGDTASITLAGDTLDLILVAASRGTLDFSFDRVVNLSVDDLPVCTTKTDPAPSEGLIDRIVRD